MSEVALKPQRALEEVRRGGNGLEPGVESCPQRVKLPRRPGRVELLEFPHPTDQ